MSKRRALGDQQAMALVRIRKQLIPAMADTGTQRSIFDHEIARKGGAVPTGKTGTMNIAGQRLRGKLMKLTITVPRSRCFARVEAFVPDPGQPFRKGAILGMDFLQAAKMIIKPETGEAYYPKRRH